MAIHIVLQVAEDDAAVVGRGRRWSSFPPSSISGLVFASLLRSYFSDQAMNLWSPHGTRFLSSLLSGHVPGIACSCGEDKGGLAFL